MKPDRRDTIMHGELNDLVSVRQMATLLLSAHRLRYVLNEHLQHTAMR